MTVHYCQKPNGRAVPASFFASVAKAAVLASYLAMLSKETAVSIRDGMGSRGIYRQSAAAQEPQPLCSAWKRLRWDQVGLCSHCKDIALPREVVSGGRNRLSLPHQGTDGFSLCRLAGQAQTNRVHPGDRGL